MARPPELGVNKSISAAPSVTDDAADESRKPDNEPRQRVEVLVTSACGRGLPARRARAGSLEPRDKEEKNAGGGQEPECGTGDMGAKHLQKRSLLVQRDPSRDLLEDIVTDLVFALLLNGATTRPGRE